MNKFEQVSSLDHQMSLAGGGTLYRVTGAWSCTGGLEPVSCKEGAGPCMGGAGSGPCTGAVKPYTADDEVLYKGMGPCIWCGAVQSGPMHHG